MASPQGVFVWLIALLVVVALVAPEQYRQRAERLLDKLLGWLRPPWHRNEDDPPQLGQGGSS